MQGIVDNGASESTELPRIAQDTGLTERQIGIIQAILEKDPEDTWEQVAERLKISRRTLYAYRQDPQMQEVLLAATLDILKSELIDVVKALARKAKQGNVGAAKVMLEYGDRAWNLEQRYQHQLAKIKEVVLSVMEKAAPELSMEVARGFQQIELNGGSLPKSGAEGSREALPAGPAEQEPVDLDAKQDASILPATGFLERQKPG